MKIFFENFHEEIHLSSKGSYAVVLRVDRSTALSVGRLGRIRFAAGYYVYVGSAQGPGGLGARLGRHRRTGKPLRWHIDYLRERAVFHGAWTAAGTENREHCWAELLEKEAAATVPAPGFGASDCRCTAHLFHLPNPPERFGVFDRLPGGPVRTGEFCGWSARQNDVPKAAPWHKGL